MYVYIHFVYLCKIIYIYIHIYIYTRWVIHAHCAIHPRCSIYARDAFQYTRCNCLHAVCVYAGATVGGANPLNLCETNGLLRVVDCSMFTTTPITQTHVVDCEFAGGSLLYKYARSSTTTNIVTTARVGQDINRSMRTRAELLHTLSDLTNCNSPMLMKCSN